MENVPSIKVIDNKVDAVFVVKLSDAQHTSSDEANGPCR